MHPKPAPEPPKFTFSHIFQVATFIKRAAGLVWTTSRSLAIWFFFLTLLAGVIPGAIAYVSKMLVDSVVHASASHVPSDQDWAFTMVALEGGTVMLLAAIERANSVCQSLLRAQLGQRVNVMILEKTLTLNLSHFEDSEFYDKLSQARRQASNKPMSMVSGTMALARNALNLLTYAGLLFSFSPWAVLILIAAGLPTFIMDARFSGQAFRLFTWRSPETRQQLYLENLLATEDKAKEVMLFRLGKMLLARYEAIFEKLYAEDRALTMRRAGWGFLLGTLATGVLYGAYFWVVSAAVVGKMTLGEMTMLLMVFKQGQSAVTNSLGSISSLYEDNLYLNNLYEFLGQPVVAPTGTATVGTVPGDGVRFENVSFAYPGQEKAALENMNFHLAPGKKLALVGENGSGKTTLVKLLARLYTPTQGRVLLDGLDLQEWDQTALRERIGVIFQDFVRYAFLVGENVGVGDVERIEEEERWRQASKMGLADEFVEALPEGYRTQLGRWFAGGRDLSGGQWQKLALSRAFMRPEADILVLDEPTSAVDPRAEVQLFERFREVTKDQMVILISHRFSTVRIADYILVLDKGKVLEEGSHDSLLEQNGHYANLFRLQAAGYT